MKGRLGLGHATERLFLMSDDPTLIDIFPGDSVMAGAMRAHDWSTSPLGDPATWPEGLKVPLRMMLTSRFEMWLGWGPDLAFFYNDAYLPTLGRKHPDALGRPVRVVWREIFDEVVDRFDSVLREGRATWDKALMLLLERNGFPEETYHTFSYSPLRGDSGAIEGLMCVVSEETERVISERRLDTLRFLANALVGVRTLEDVARAVRATLAANTHDFPFASIRLFDGAASGDGPLDSIAWPFDMVRKSGAALVTPLAGLIDDPPRGPWALSPTQALIAPISTTGPSALAGALVLGLNPHGRAGADIADFAQLICAQIAGALAVVDGYAKEALQIERLRQLFEQSPSFIAVLRGPEHRFELMNAAYLQLVGHRTLVGQPVREALPEVEGQGFFELLDGVYASGEPFRGDAVPIALQATPGAEPHHRYLDFVYQPIRESDGQISGIFVEGFDVTTRHDALEALRQSEAQFRTFAEAMPNHVWTSRPDGHLDWFNRRVYEYGGAAEGELNGAGWTAMVHPEDLPVAAARWAAAIASGETYETEFRLRRADGVYRWHLARAVCLRSETGAIARWVGANTDIDDQKATAQALADLNSTLEEQVEARTAELMAAEEALRQSQKMEAVGQLTGGIAHDFNNLLAGISGSLQMLEARIAQGRFDAVPRYADAAQSAVKRAAALTQRLLAFSRRQTLDPRSVNANRLIAGMEELIRRTVGPAVQLEVVGAGGLWLTLVDPNQLENALLNLCINARDAMPHGGRLTIETANKWLDDRAARERDLPPGQYVSLCVTDTGTGMSPEVAAQAFNPFFTTKPLGQGTGLGLSMIYGFARQSGGQVRIYSEVGLGTTMCIYLPRYAGSESEAEEGQGPAPAGYGGHGETVLVVDDEPVLRMLIVDVLQDAGYKAVEAEDGPQALRVLQSGAPIDLLITDVGLPGGLNGRQVADAGRVLRPHLKVIFITGYAENAVVGNGRLEPGMQIITKPFSVGDLGEKIREMIDRPD
jgi:PAS domain S-box-containing protein